jgi:type IV pilus assembly protein PilM
MQKYCSDCGAQLWEPCLQCGALSLASEKYCGDCGANLAQGIERLVEQLEASLARVEQLRTDCRYDEAVCLLGPMRKAEHPRLRKYVDQADQLAKQLTAERDQRIAQSKAAYHEASALVARCDYEAAMRLLEDVPSAMRSSQTQQLREEVQARLEEIALLEEALSTTIVCQRTIRLLPKVSRLLTLKPGHVGASQLAERFRDCVYQAAEKKLFNHEYRDARELLDQMPEVARDTKFETLHRRAAELVWLSEDLRNAPLVDATLVQVAERFAKLVPDDQRTGKLLMEVRRRERIAAGNPRRAHPPWASPPKETRLGCPIDWLTGFQRIGISDELAKPILVDHPGCLFVACGLALQGLQQAPIRLNLLPQENQTPLGRIGAILKKEPSSWVGRKQSPRSAWGLDLSARGLKAVKLAWKGQEEGVVIEDFDVVTHGKMIGEALNDAEAKTLVRGTLDAFCSRNHVKADRICLGLSARTLLTRHLTVPPADPKKLEKAVAYEAKRHIPIPLEKATWDFQVMVRGNGERTSKPEQDVLLVAARRQQLVDRLSAFRDAGLRVDVLQSDCLALYNFLVFDHFGNGRGEDPSPPEPGRHIALLDVGSSQTHLVVGSPTSVWFRSSGMGGEQFTRALVQELQLTAAQAEELKRRPARAESLNRMYDALEPSLEALVTDARSMLHAFAADNQTQRIERVLGCGGSFRLHGLWRHLRSSVSPPTS